MIANLGFYLLFMCCLLSIYGTAAAIGAGVWRHRRLYLSAKMAATTTCVLVLVAAGLLWFSFFERDFSLFYVFKNSSSDLPWFYTISAFWSSLEGSHFLWTILITIFATTALWTHAKDNEHIMPHVTAAISAVMAWMYYLLITHSDPFVLSLPAAPEGRGMNELLQNPYMMIHPPLLFTGYTGLSVPFAYSLAALAYGDVTQGWLKTVRRWTLFSWIALTAAITLGGRWAYVELGWAGYWAWDPVENSSFLPWLLATASLHSLLIQEKLGHLKRMTLVLTIIAFFLSFFGTFITRSGVITSVHSFAESNIGPNYLMYLAGIATVSMLLYAWRAPRILPSEVEKVWGISKESALIVTLFLLLSFASIVFIGTVFPIVTEALSGQRISVQGPYFNAFAPYIGLLMIVAIAFGNLMRYQSPKIPYGRPIMFWSVVFAVPATFVLAYLGDLGRTPKFAHLIAQYVGLFFCSWAFACLCGDFWVKLKDLRFNWKLMGSRNLAYCGAFVAHVGIIVAIVGFLGNYRGLERKVTLKVGEKAELYHFQFEFRNGVTTFQEHNVTHFVAPVFVTMGDKEVGYVEPSLSRYPTKPNQTFNEVGVKSGWWNDIYIVLADFDQQNHNVATFNIHINPTVRFVWLAIVLMCIGGIMALFDKHRGNKSRDAIAGEWELGV